MLHSPDMDTERCLAEPLPRSLLFRKELPLGFSFSLFRKLVTFCPPAPPDAHVELTKEVTVRDLTMFALVLMPVVGRDRASGAGVAAALPGVLPLLMPSTLLNGFAAGLATSAMVLRRWLGLVLVVGGFEVEAELVVAVLVVMADSIAIVMRTPTCLSCVDENITFHVNIKLKTDVP